MEVFQTTNCFRAATDCSVDTSIQDNKRLSLNYIRFVLFFMQSNIIYLVILATLISIWLLNEDFRNVSVINSVIAILLIEQVSRWHNLTFIIIRVVMLYND